MNNKPGYIFRTCFGSVNYLEGPTFDEMLWSNEHNNYSLFVHGIQECLYPNKVLLQTPLTQNESTTIRFEDLNIQEEHLKIKQNLNGWEKPKASVSFDMDALCNKLDQSVISETSEYVKNQFVYKNALIQSGNSNCNGMVEKQNLDGRGKPKASGELSESQPAKSKNTIQREKVNQRKNEKFLKKKCVEGTSATVKLVREMSNGKGKPKAFVQLEMGALFNQLEQAETSEAQATPVAIRPKKVKKQRKANKSRKNYTRFAAAKQVKTCVNNNESEENTIKKMTTNVLNTIYVGGRKKYICHDCNTKRKEIARINGVP